MSKKKAHFLGFVQHGVNSHATGMWRHPKDKINWDWTRPPYWQHLARTMERGLFDAMFIADELAPYNNYESSSDATVKYAVQCPMHEPSTIVPIITTATANLGVGVTLSTAFEHPYSMCAGFRAWTTCPAGASPGTSSAPTRRASGRPTAHEMTPAHRAGTSASRSTWSSATSSGTPGSRTRS